MTCKTEHSPGGRKAILKTVAKNIPSQKKTAEQTEDARKKVY